MISPPCTPKTKRCSSLTAHTLPFNNIPPPMSSSSLVSIDEKLYLFGGQGLNQTSNSLYIYDTIIREWKLQPTFGQIPRPRRAHSCVAYAHYLLVYGGGQGTMFYDDLCILDTKTLHWRIIPNNPPGKRRSHCSGIYKDSMVIFGGGNGINGLDDFWSLDLDTFEWEKLPSCGPSPRGFACLVCDDSSAYIYGGADSKRIFADLWRFDFDTCEWIRLSSSLKPIFAHQMQRIGPLLLVSGGCSDGVSLNCSIFDTRTETWNESTPVLPLACAYHSMSLVQDEIYVFGGNLKQDNWAVIHLGVYTSFLDPNQ